MRTGRRSNSFYISFNSPRREDYGLLGMATRFVINVAALWLAQALVRGFDIESASALIFGALIFGIVNAVIKPVITIVSCPLTCLTLGFFLLVINALMLGITAWIADLFGLAFEVDGFIAALLGALIIAVTSALLTTWADRTILGKGDDRYEEW
jgi:putative membrane protein